jgi:hypothetical protein
MKKLNKIFGLFLVTVFVFALLSPVNAQRSYRGNRGEYNRSYGGDYARQSRGYSYYRPPFVSNYQYRYAPRYVSYPRGSISISFGGNPYYYGGGSFYRPYGGSFRRVMPPIGIRIGILPVGYTPVYVGPHQYYFSEGTYYRRYDDSNYEVVDAPMGAELSSLPRNAKSVMVNGEKFYELNGTYYKEDRNSKGQVVYVVVGKNGKIDNSEELPAAPAVGDKVSQIPLNSKTVTINGQKLFVAPDDTYYQAEADGSYTVVGIANP